jgi:hypothetical protein
MPKLPGTFDGNKYEDLRVLLPKSIQDHYKKEGKWDNIILVKFYNESEVVWLRDVMGKSVLYRKHKWGYKEVNNRISGAWRYIKADDWQQDPPRGAKLQ